MSINATDHIVFDVMITSVFVIIALMLLFPSNGIIPLDRRFSSLLGACLCTGIMTLFPATNSNNTGGYVDFNVLLVLTAIMVINYLLLRQPWLANAVSKMQNIIRADVDRGFYVVSMISFLASPFILNDGLCLMLVHPVLDAFVTTDDNTIRGSSLNQFLPSDAFYYMLTIACSANIGSVMTFSGNPQNLIVAQYVGKYMNCGTFFLYMFVPATVSWFLTVALLNYYRKQARSSSLLSGETQVNRSNKDSKRQIANHQEQSQYTITSSEDVESEEEGMGSVEMIKSSSTGLERRNKSTQQTEVEHSELDQQHSTSQELSSNPTSTKQTKKATIWDQILKDPSLDPMSCPWIVFPGFLLLIILEFTGTYPLPGLFSVLTVFITVGVIMTNYYYQSYRFLQCNNGQQLANHDIEEESNTKSNDNDRIQLLSFHEKKVVPPSIYIHHISATIEDLFHHHIDYNLLIIFIGLFIVSGSFLTTHIPKVIWSTLAGPKPFMSFSSVLVLSIYIIGMSQLVGNVPVVYMAKEEVVLLPNQSTQIYAWLLLAYVSTIAGNFTLVGSAANIIVVEKAMRHKKYPVFIRAIPHFKICGIVTLLCIAIGVICIYLETLLFL